VIMNNLPYYPVSSRGNYGIRGRVTIFAKDNRKKRFRFTRDLINL